MKYLIFLVSFLLAGCLPAFNKTIHTYSGQTTICRFAMMDEGGVCWHGYACTPDIGNDPTECPKHD